ncbi:MAG: hypothetical protein ACOYON_14270 [Fimbriimonas sp.]
MGHKDQSSQSLNITTGHLAVDPLDEHEEPKENLAFMMPEIIFKEISSSRFEDIAELDSDLRMLSLRGTRWSKLRSKIVDAGWSQQFADWAIFSHRNFDDLRPRPFLGSARLLKEFNDIDEAQLHSAEEALREQALDPWDELPSRLSRLGISMEFALWATYSQLVNGKLIVSRPNEGFCQSVVQAQREYHFAPQTQKDALCKSLRDHRLIYASYEVFRNSVFGLSWSETAIYQYWHSQNAIAGDQNSVIGDHSSASGTSTELGPPGLRVVNRDMTDGAKLFAIGALLTAISYSMPFHGFFFVFRGALVIGFFRFLWGLISYVFPRSLPY